MQHQLSIQYPQHWLDALQLTQKSFEEGSENGYGGQTV
jgi:hypothetical protein